ncbi:C-terminal of Roc, COR, domain [Chitinophaga sp. CF118]|uniref:TIR domain-containing protein n=1 Tax=Chitinophaga sp. CF118 TaxID=1884367 RepID=UPI0008EEBBA6|nr:TIR domain-containing protein [Chitinophaga sp. CF118]SFE40088.1 C-terminal of Roc, COR, domain [Chitinophaga sp. CF118]
MSDNKFTGPRLLAAAKDFNIGKKTLIDFLHSKGFDMSNHGSPNARLNEKMYNALKAEFPQDRVRYSDKPANIERALRIIEQCQIEQEAILDLGNCGLVDNDFIEDGALDKKLQSCSHVKKFILSSIWRKPNSNLEKEKSRNVGRPNKMSKLPNCVLHFIKLESIICCGTSDQPWDITDLSLLQKLPYLSHIDFSYNKIESLYFIKHNSALKKNNFEANNLSSLDGIENLKSLEYLSAEENNIESVFQLENTPNLNWVNLGNNNISDTKWLGKLHALVTLFLNDNRIENTAYFADNKNLKYLDLSNNIIDKIDDFPGLINLGVLDLKGNLIENIFQDDSKSAWDTNGLPKLTILDLSNNMIRKIRRRMNLSQLKRLLLTNNSLISLDGLQNLKTLHTLHVEENNLDEEEALNNILNIESLVHVYLSGNKVFNDLPEEVVAAGWRAIRDRLKAGKLVSFNEVKVLLLGNPNVGKSNLLEYLETKAPPRNNETTFGIQYKELCIGESNITMHFWDFGGQEYFHATHQLFFSPGGLHIVLYSREDVQRDKDNPDICFDLSYWIRCVERLIPNDARNKIEVIVAENKIDLNDYRITALNQLAYTEKYPNLNFEFTSFSVLHLKRLRGFLDLLEESGKKLVRTHPSSYLNYHDKIKKATTSSVPISYIADSQEEEEVVKTAMLVFRNMGLLLYFDKIIPDRVFVKPQVLLDLLYKNILGEQKSMELTKEEIEQKVKDNDLGITTNEVIDLLINFDLVFQIPDCSNIYFVPQYLKPPHTLVNFFKQHQFLFPDIFIESDNFLMNVAMLKIFSHYGKYVQGKYVKQYLFWKDGIVLEKDEMILMINFNRQMERIELYSDVKSKNFQLQKEVIDFILHLRLDKHKTIHEEHTEKPDFDDEGIDWSSDYFSVYISLDGVFYTSWSKLIENVDNDILQIKLSSVHRTSEIPENIILTKTTSVFDFNKFLPKKSKGQMKKIFISYSKEDLRMVNKFQEHLSALKLDGKVTTWYCTELSAGGEWNFEIQSHFDDADIVCFMVSPNFMKTKYIHEYEIKKAFKRKSENPDFMIVPIILDFCRWTTNHNNLGDYSALPYSAKPVADFSNQNMAWYIVQECLRFIIDNKDSNRGDALYNNPGLPKDVLQIFERIMEHKVDNNSN